MVANQTIHENAFLGTDVTWEDIESDLRASLGTTAVFGPNKSVSNIGDGSGFLSKVGLVEPDWQNVSENEVLPEKFVVKIASILNVLAFSAKMAAMKGTKDGFACTERQQKLLGQLWQLHNTEATVYDLLKSHNCKLPIAKVYCSKKFSENNKTKGFLVMDYVKSEAKVHIYANLSVNDIRKILPIIAKIQLTSLLMTEEERSQLSTNPIGMHFRTAFTEEALRNFGSNIRWLGTERANELATIVDEKISEIANLAFYDGIPEQMNMKRVLLHGDLWPLNCIWSSSSDGIEIKALLDWQLAGLTTPVADLVKFFNTHMSGEDRRKYTEILLEEFYEIFREMVMKVNEEMPYSLEQLKEAYKRFFPIGAAVAYSLAGGVGRTFMEKLPSELKEKAREVLCEKTTCLVEDMLYFHNRNLEMKLL